MLRVWPGKFVEKLALGQVPNAENPIRPARDEPLDRPGVTAMLSTGPRWPRITSPTCWRDRSIPYLDRAVFPGRNELSAAAYED